MNYLGMVIAAHFVHSGDTVLEIGANRGTETYSLANIIGPSGLVVAIEADKKTAEILRGRVTRLRQVKIVEQAVADHVGRKNWHRNDDAPGTSFLGSDTSSFSNVTTVDTVTVDELASQYGAPSFIFMDVEGAEYQCLKGARKTLDDVRPIIFTEVNGSLLTRAGASMSLFCDAIRAAHYVAFDVNPRMMPPVDLTAPDKQVVSDWLLLPAEMRSRAAAVRSVLLRARFMPRVFKLNPLDQKFYHP